MLKKYSAEKLVYLDESGVNTHMTKIYGRAMLVRCLFDFSTFNFC